MLLVVLALAGAEETPRRNGGKVGSTEGKLSNSLAANQGSFTCSSTSVDSCQPSLITPFDSKCIHLCEISSSLAGFETIPLALAHSRRVTRAYNRMPETRHNSTCHLIGSIQGLRIHIYTGSWLSYISVKIYRSFG
jgi:hypothetical protein